MQASAQGPDQRFTFFVSTAVVASVVVFAAGVIVTLLRRSDRRRAEEEKLAALGTATARILHQIKNPLQTIVLHADILQDERIVSEAGQRREVCDAIVGESQRLVAMLEELSVYASGSRAKLTRTPVRLDQLVQQVAATEIRESAGTGVKVSVPALAEVVVLADTYYLRQVFENLVRNAREAMQGQADARLELRLERSGAAAEVRISDNGPGISQEKLETVFQPFVSSKAKGMGLGLAIVREIVEGHGGTIEAQSRPGEGTSFVVQLPLHGEGTPAVAA
ncbi:MAG TPA: ATP-binding protein [Longimicrobiaceae bacterium]|nr:ATP-binding protein [Longimicrobiaceae bacterium]